MASIGRDGTFFHQECVRQIDDARARAVADRYDRRHKRGRRQEDHRQGWHAAAKSQSPLRPSDIPSYELLEEAPRIATARPASPVSPWMALLLLLAFLSGAFDRYTDHSRTSSCRFFGVGSCVAESTGSGTTQAAAGALPMPVART